MNSLDTNLELAAIAAAKYASDGKLEDESSTIVEALVDGYFDEQVKAVMAVSGSTLIDTLCSVVGDSHIINHKNAIIADILTYSKWELLVQVMYRAPYKTAVRRVLYRLNEHSDMYANIKSSARFDAVYSNFVKWFETYAVCAYEQDTFTGYIKKAFENFYYKQYKKDIWEALRDIDFAKKEVDTKQSLSSVVLKVVESGDVYINPLLTNIYLANKLLFQHSGHTLNAIVYDIFHLILNYRIQKYVDQINAKLTTLSLEIIDTGLPGVSSDLPNQIEIPKGAISKISNALDIVPKLYEYISQKKLNDSFIADLREYAFNLGKGATSDSNCMWKLDDDTKGTQCYLDKGRAINNYANFEILLNGIMSVYTLMSCMEERGISIVDVYDPAFFKNIDLIRNLDYLSSLEHKDLIMELQADTSEMEKTDLLDTFDELVYSRAGSAENNRIDNKLRRERAYTFGMLKNPALKQKKINSSFERLKGIYLQLAAVPKSYAIYETLAADLIGNSHTSAKIGISPDILGSSVLYDTLNYNEFLGRKQFLTSKYLYSYRHIDTSFSMELPTLAQDRVQGYLVFNGNEYPYNEEAAGFFIGNKLILLSDLQRMMANSASTDFSFIEKPCIETVSIKMFPIFLGLQSIHGNRQQQALERIYARNKENSFAAKQYHMDLFGLSCVQEEFVGFLPKIQYVLNAYLKAGLNEQASVIVKQFIAKEFVEDAFNKFLDDLFYQYGKDIQQMSVEDLIVDKTLTLFEKCVAIAFRSNDWKTDAYRIVNECSYAEEVKNIYREFLSIFELKASPAKVFAMMYSFIYGKLLFLIELRDSYEIVFLVQNMEIKSLISELITRFDVANWEYKISENVTFGYALDTVPNSDIIAFIQTTIKTMLFRYKYILSEFNKYIKSCTESFQILYKYTTNHTVASRQEFKAYGEMFNRTRNKTGIESLDKLREICVCDESGFFMRNGDYLKSYYRNSTYYIHYTGNLLISSGDSFHPMKYSEYTDKCKEDEFAAIISQVLSY